MRSAVYRAPRDVAVVDLPVPELGPGDVLLRVAACGVCGSDLASFADGHYIEAGQVMGHEIAATVESEHPDLALGALVAVRPMRSCGACDYCRVGDTHLCEHTFGPSLGYGAAGGFADLVVVREAVAGRDVVAVPAHVEPLDLLWAEPLAVALHAVERAGDDVRELLVMGAGAVGLTVAAAALADGTRVTVVEPLDGRRDAAASLGAATHAPGGLPADASFDAVIDASGVTAAVIGALPHLRHRAPIVLVGLSDSSVVYPSGGHPVVGAFAYRQRDFERAVDLIVSGLVRLGSFVTRSFDLDYAAAALEPPRVGDHTVKVAIVPRRKGPQK